MNECRSCRKYTRCEDRKLGKQCKLYIDKNEARVCWHCGRMYGIEEHHMIHGTSNRKHSERLGLVIDLCSECHTGRNRHSAHNSPEWNLKYKQMAQRCFEGRGHSREEFMSIFGRNFLE